MTVGELARSSTPSCCPRRHGGRLAELEVVQVRAGGVDAVRRHRPAVDHAEPEHADAGHGAALPGHLPVRGDQPVRGPRDDPAVRADRRAVPGLPLGAGAGEPRLPGHRFREAYFTPFSKHANKVCAGVQVHITDPHRVEAIAVATNMIVEAKRLYADFDWRPGDNPPGRWIDLLTGSDRFRTMLDAGASAEEIVAAWRTETDAWTARRPVPAVQGRPPVKRLLTVAVASTLMLTMASPAVASSNKSGRFDAPYDGFAPKSTLLRDSTPAKAGLDPAPIDAALAQVEAWTQPSGTVKPLYAGAVTLLGHDGKVVTRKATGLALKYADGRGTELPADQQIPMRTDTIFDMASVSKLFTSIVVMQQVETGRVGLDTPIATYVPEFAAERQGSGHGPAGADAHHRAARLAAAVERAARPGVADADGADREADQRARHDVPVLRPEPDRARRAGAPGHRQAAGQAGRRRHHQAAADARHRLQPGPDEAAADRGHGVPDGPAARHGLGLGARRERLVAGRRRRACGGVLHRGRPGRAGADLPERRQLPRGTDPHGELRHRDDHQLQPGLPGQRPRARLRAEPALVHGRPVRVPAPRATPATPGRRS